MKKHILIFLASTAILSGCKGYMGGFDDSNIGFVQLVLMNRSSHEIELRFSETRWNPEGDTIRLESGNGLWKHDFTDDLNSNVFFRDMEMVIDGKEIPFSFLWSSLDNRVNIQFELDGQEYSLSGRCKFGKNKFSITIEDTESVYPEKKIVMMFVKQ